MRIAQAAILQNGRIFTGRRHCEIIRDIVRELEIPHVNGAQGFTTDTGVFVDREEAARIALACGQIKELTFSTKRLFSEELW